MAKQGKAPSKLAEFKRLEELGRVRLSPNFFMREFLHSEISQIECIPNIPHHPEIAIKYGSLLCERVLEPIQEYFGRISIRSGYRSPEINALGAINRNQYNCASNDRNVSRHIWDYPNLKGHYGATSCIVICKQVDHFISTGDWKCVTNWIRENVPECSRISVHPRLCTLSVSWHDESTNLIKSHIRN